jgi:hypothetical protein
MEFLGDVRAAEVENLLAAWRADYPKMGVLALVPEADHDAVSALQALCNSQGIPLVGAIFPALVLDSQFHSRGVLLLRFDEMPYAALYPELGPSPGEEIAGALKDQLDASRQNTLFMIFDAMVPNIATILDELYLKLADRVHYMGVNAGSETFQPTPCLFDNQRLVQGGVLVLLLRHHPGAILEHGYEAPAEMISATSTEGNRVIQIDWRPAFEVYQEMMQARYGVAVNKENFYQYAVHFPFGIVRANNEILVRIPVALEDDGSLFCVGEVPTNAVLTLLHAPEVDSVQTVATLVNGLAALSGPEAEGEILLFYCAGRRLHIGEQAQNELQELARRTRAVRIAGALSLGEIGSSVEGGYPLFHNATLVCSRWEG